MRRAVLAALFLVGCRGSSGGRDDDAGPGDPPDAEAPDLDDAARADAAPLDAAIPDAAVADPDAASCGTPTECAAIWEQAAADRFDDLLDDPVALDAFLRAVPKGGDLHQHLNGAVYAETYLGWADEDGDCINSTSYAAVGSGSCSASNLPVPGPGSFYDQIVRAWSMEGFVAGAETGHDHFFATFGKYGLVAGAHRDDSIADVMTRAAGENQVYVETMFTLGRNVGTLAASIWSGAVTPADLQSFYDQLMNHASFAAELASDVNVVNVAASGWRAQLGCDDIAAPPACEVTVRFVAQVSRTGGNDTIFGQLVSAFEMARQTSQIVAVNLSSPEDDDRSINNYELHMAMLDFLYQKYTATGLSPLHVTLHAGELTDAYLPPGSDADTFHIRRAVEVGHAERIGHGLDVMSETDPAGLMAEMAARGVLVEICLSSNLQILEVSGGAHPLAAYRAAGVPVALATDDQGVSRSSLAGEYRRGALDQGLDYRALKRLARDSLEHAFAGGASLWASLDDVAPVAACAPDDAMGIGDPPDAECAAFLEGSARATLQWELERRFRVFEAQQ